MEMLFYILVLFCIMIAFCREGNGRNCIFLKTVKWSKVIILTDDQDFVYISKHLSQNLISARVAPLNNFKFNELNNFSSVLIISKPNTAIGLVEEGLKVIHCPSNWLLILEEKLENFGKFFIPHDIALFLLDARHFYEVLFIFRLYSANGNVIKTQESGFWNPKKSMLHFSRMPVSLPSYIDTPLRLTTISFEPFFSYRKKRGQLTIGGFHGKILKIIRSVFFFNASVTIPEDKLFGIIVNESYVSGILGKLHRNESDIGISLSKTISRIQLISYSLDITRVHMKILYHNMLGDQERFFFYLEPFSRVSWICIMAFTILFVVLLLIISFIKNKFQRWPEKVFNHVQIIYYYLRSALYILLRTGIPVRVCGISGRICLLVFYIFCIIMFTSYCSSLISILSVTRLKLPFNSFHDLLYNSDYDLATLKDSVIVQILKISNDVQYRKAYEKLNSKPQTFLVRSNEIGIELIYNQKIAYLMDEVTMVIVVGNNCSYRFFDEVIIKTDFCFSFNKQFLYKKLFDKYILLLLENGVIQKLQFDSKPADHNAYCDGMQRESAAIKIPAVVGLFVTLCIGIGIALIAFIFEVLCKMLF
uniref:Ionotropic glutamate receptor C-terminal domain-containing protein n=1 Tax=Strigamia maritima TaxID=126957 RepID=T1JBJ6_STRMM